MSLYCSIIRWLAQCRPMTLKYDFFQYFPYPTSEDGGLFPNDFYDMGDVPTSMVIFNVVGCNDQILLTKYFRTSSIIGCTNSILLFLKVHSDDNHWNLQIPPWFGLLFLTFGIDWSSSHCYTNICIKKNLYSIAPINLLILQ